MTAYWIAHVTINDPEKYAGYQALAPAAFGKYGAVFLARGGVFDTLEGPDFARHVVIAFASMADARACYASDEYQNAKAHRDGACIAHVTLLDGLR